MTNQEKKDKKQKEAIAKSEKKPPITIIKEGGYRWSWDGIHNELYERGKTYEQYPDKLLEALRKEPVPVATFEGKIIPAYENKLMPAPENKSNVLLEYLNGLNVQALKAMCQSKKIDTKSLSKQEMIDALMAVK